MRKIVFFQLFLFLICVFPLLGYTQDIVNDFYAKDNQFNIEDNYTQLDIIQSPQYPTSGDTVTVTLNGYANDIDRASITYKVNGEAQASAIGKKSFSFVVGSSDTVTLLSIEVVLPTGFSYIKNVVIRPTVVSLAWEADTYTPPFYEGKSLYTDQAKLKVVAYARGTSANGSILSPLQTVYTWKKNNRTIQDQSGTGANIYVQENDTSVLSGADLFLTLESFDKTLKAEKEIRIPVSKPEIAFYENDLSSGLSTKRIRTQYELTKDTVTLAGIPFFIAHSFVNNSSLVLKWFMNSEEIPTSEPILTIEKPEKTGYAQIEMQAQAKDKLFQRAQAKLRVTFNADE